MWIIPIIVEWVVAPIYIFGHDPRVVDTLRLAHNEWENASYHYAEQVFR